MEIEKITNFDLITEPKTEVGIEYYRLTPAFEVYQNKTNEALKRACAMIKTHSNLKYKRFFDIQKCVNQIIEN